MVYMVIMKLDEDAYGEAKEGAEGVVTESIIPSLKRLKDLEKKGSVKGGFFNGQRAGAIIIDAESDSDLDKILTSLPIWGIFDFEVVRLESFDDALERDERVAKQLKAASNE